MSKTEKLENAFLKSLKNRGIGIEINEQIPEKFHKNYSIPKDTSCIPVPLIESDEWVSPEQAGYITKEEISHQDYFILQKKLFFERNKPKPAPKEDTNPQLLAAKSPEEFVELKKEINTYYSTISEKEDLSLTIHVCNYPTCLYNAVPTFDYCLSHLGMDPRFGEDLYFHKCTQCDNVATLRFKRCKFHSWKPHK